LAESLVESGLAPQKGRCALCSLPVGRSRAMQTINGESLHFCCQGCLNVFLMLFNSPEGVPANFRETNLYRSCIECGIIPRDEGDLIFREAQGDAGIQNPSYNQIQGDGASAQELTLKVEGMWCPSCAWLIEEVLRKTRGVLETKVFFLSDTAQIKYLPQYLNPSDILTKIIRLGYHPSSFEDESESSEERRNLLFRLGISSFLTANIMMISFALYMGFFQDLGQQAVRYLSYPLVVLATPVIFYGGLPILKRAYVGLRYGSASMDTLISVGALAAYFYSIFQMAKGTLHVYFDTASMLITLVLVGRYIEAQVKGRISKSITELYRLANQKVRLLTMGRERWVSPEAVEPGDEFLVIAGERVPLDGLVTLERAIVDESILTGESRPVKKGMGDEIMGGTLLLDGQLKLKATRTGPESSLKQMIKLMQEALTKKNPFELLADKIMKWFVPVIFTLTGGTTAFLLWQGVSIDVALLRAVTILVITCPCALGIASPLAKVIAIGAGRRRGILVRDPGALEIAKDLDAFVLDKTGTMTEGNFHLREVTAQGVTKQEAFRRLASVELHSSHFLAKEVVRTARESALRVEPAGDFEFFEGNGVKGNVGGSEVYVGNRQLMRSQEIDLPDGLEQDGKSLESEGMTVIFFAWDGKVQGLLAFGDTLKERARYTVQVLREKAIRTCLVSGDAKETTRAIAQKLGVDQYFAQALPKDKVEFIRTLQREGFRVGMVGDGINDAAALAQADVGFALGRNGGIPQEASDIALLTDDSTRVLEVLDLSALTMKTIRQNLLFAFLYNGIGIPLAVAGLLNPLIAVFAMFASSLSVIGNSLRINRHPSSHLKRNRQLSPKIQYQYQENT